MKIGLHFEDTCNDVPAPAWSELPPAINGAAQSETPSEVARGLDSHEAGRSSGASSTALGRAEDSPPTPAAAPPITERDDAAPPFKVGDKCMFFGSMSREWRPTEWNASHAELTSTKFRHPTAAELATHWPDEWIPCTSAGQRLALGDARVEVRWIDGDEWLNRHALRACSYSGWGTSITHYRLARSK